MACTNPTGVGNEQSHSSRLIHQATPGVPLLACIQPAEANAGGGQYCTTGWGTSHNVQTTVTYTIINAWYLQLRQCSCLKITVCGVEESLLYYCVFNFSRNAASSSDSVTVYMRLLAVKIVCM